MFKILQSLIIIGLFSVAAVAASTGVVTVPPSAEKIDAKQLTPDDLRLQKLTHGKYTEVWFFQLHTDDGAVMMVNLSVTNAGISKYARRSMSGTTSGEDPDRP